MSGADLVIRNARILDGSGSSAFHADVAVRDGLIEQVGNARPGKQEIDADGAVLAPGFVDSHTHDDAALLMHPGMEFKLAQGCTTVVIGNCGFSAAPRTPGRALAPGACSLFPGLDDWLPAGTTWSDLGAFFAAVDQQGPAVNAVALVGHNTLRALVMGESAQAPSSTHLAEMRALVEQALDQGACGLSSGLIYRPGRYALTDELVALCKPLAQYQALYATHLRDEADQLLDAVDEALRIGKEAGARVHISHHKSVGQHNWGKIGASLAKVNAANATGGDVSLDVYPYTMGSGPMIEYFDLQKIDVELARVMRLASCPAFPHWEGRTLPDLARELSLGLDELVLTILRAPRGEHTICIQLIVAEADIEENLRHPRMLIGSDGIANLQGKPHPRLFGTMPRILGEYVRTRRVLSLETAVHKMTAQACERFGLVKRGLIKEGYWADLALFDPETIHDSATYDDPKQEPRGMRAVVVNGHVAYLDGKHTGAAAGRALRYRRDLER